MIVDDNVLEVNKKPLEKSISPRVVIGCGIFGGGETGMKCNMSSRIDLIEHCTCVRYAMDQNFKTSLCGISIRY